VPLKTQNRKKRGERGMTQKKGGRITQEVAHWKGILKLQLQKRKKKYNEKKKGRGGKICLLAKFANGRQKRLSDGMDRRRIGQVHGQQQDAVQEILESLLPQKKHQKILSMYS